MPVLLYVQHANALGGSAFSLLYTMQGMSMRGFRCIVCLARHSEVLANLYREHGFAVEEAYGLPLFEHTTAGWGSIRHPFVAVRSVAALCNRTSGPLARLAELIGKADIVHLNSSLLLPVSRFLSARRVSHFWHIREASVEGYCGLRKALFTRQLSDELVKPIFISDYDKQTWAPASKGIVVRNFVKLGNTPNHVVTCAPKTDIHPFTLGFLGASDPIKGGRVLIDAMELVRQQKIGIECLMPGARDTGPRSRNGKIARRVAHSFGMRVERERFAGDISRRGLADIVKVMDYCSDIKGFFERCNVIIFPSIAPHFARPVIEAAAQCKPSIGSDIGGVSELIEHGKTGILVRPNDPDALAQAILFMASNPEMSHAMGMAARKKAEHDFNLDIQCDRLGKEYHAMLNNRCRA